jgi:hypothetical protein
VPGPFPRVLPPDVARAMSPGPVSLARLDPVAAAVGSAEAPSPGRRLRAVGRAALAVAGD